MLNQKYSFKVVSYEQANLGFIVDRIKLRIGDVNNQQSFASEKKWAIKRSPHVFSKSQESFGYQVYISKFNIGHTKEKAVNHYPVEALSIIKSINHLVPGLSWNWSKQSKNN